ncbi:uncharacterized protein ermn [Siphateles boraxobius]|uniref:uncharacterized protein ermn n=1 Tax=Siphateles boraxobius TaxID=180520 RepID=UPI00406312DB
MEQNAKDTFEAEKEQMNGQTEVPQETTTSEEPANIKENKKEEEISVNKADENEGGKTKEEEEENEEEEPDFQPSVEMSVQEYEKDKKDRPVCRYNTVCYRKIKKGNTMQRIDEFESILNV